MGYCPVKWGIGLYKMGCLLVKWVVQCLCMKKYGFGNFQSLFIFLQPFSRFEFATFGPKTEKMSCLLVKMGCKLVTWGIKPL